jgi:hypothetical protein
MALAFFILCILSTNCAHVQARVDRPSTSEDIGALPQFDGAMNGDQPTAFKEVCILMEMVGKGKDSDVRFTLSMDQIASRNPADQSIPTFDNALERLKVLLEKNREPVQVTIKAHSNVRAIVLLQMLKAMEELPFRNKITTIYRGVIEKP